jgi:hypothetical protein
MAAAAVTASTADFLFMGFLPECGTTREYVGGLRAVA